MKAANLIPLVLFFCLAVILAYVTNLAGNNNFIPSMVGKKLESFKTQELTTNSLITDKDFKQNGLIINLFASWCVSCQEEHELVKDLAAKGYKIYGIDVADTKAEALNYLKKNGNPYEKVAFDGNRAISISLGATGIPETYVVNNEGVIYFHHRGVLDEDIIKNQLLPIVDELRKKTP